MRVILNFYYKNQLIFKTSIYSKENTSLLKLFTQNKIQQTCPRTATASSLLFTIYRKILIFIAKSSCEIQILNYKYYHGNNSWHKCLHNLKHIILLCSLNSLICFVREWPLFWCEMIKTLYSFRPYNFLLFYGIF